MRSVAPAAPQDFQLGMLDGPLLTLPTGEGRKPAKGFTVIAPSNSAPDLSCAVASKLRFIFRSRTRR
jgi:hypothetical protein